MLENIAIKTTDKVRQIFAILSLASIALLLIMTHPRFHIQALILPFKHMTSFPHSIQQGKRQLNLCILGALEQVKGKGVDSRTLTSSLRSYGSKPLYDTRNQNAQSRVTLRAIDSYASRNQQDHLADHPLPIKPDQTVNESSHQIALHYFLTLQAKDALD